MITSAVLVGAGTFSSSLGLAVGSSHLLSVTRLRVREMEVRRTSWRNRSTRKPEPRWPPVRPLGRTGSRPRRPAFPDPSSARVAATG